MTTACIAGRGDTRGVGIGIWIVQNSFLRFPRPPPSIRSSSVMAAARTWLADHPEDDEIRGAIWQLSKMERDHFTYTR